MKYYTLHLIWLKKKNNKSIYITYLLPIYFQPEKISYLCQVVPNVVYDLGLVDTNVHREPVNICTKYSLLLIKFVECHQMLNGKIEFDDERVEGFSKM